MKKSILLLAALAAVACGNQGETQKAPEVVTPNVEVATAESRDVPQENVYASRHTPLTT